MVDGGCGMRWGWGSSVVVVVVGGDDGIRGKNGLDSHDPPCQQWGMHEERGPINS